MKFSKPLFFISTYLLAFLLFLPGLFNFYSHDDFFHYKIAETHSFKEFLGFFDLTRGPENWGYYRPLTTQVLYFLGREVFNFNPVIMHAIAFLMFFIVVFLVFSLVKALTEKEPLAYLATFFYATSASHFSHLYSVANQELGHAIFFLTSTIFFVKFLKKKNFKYYWISFGSFLAALTCKESAVMLVPSLVLIYALLRLKRQTLIPLKRFVFFILPFLALLAAYAYLHIFYYGLVKGESYIWVFTPQAALNSLLWYGLWSLGLPKMLAEFEFFKSGLKFNLSLFKIWPQEVIIALCLFGVLLLFLAFFVLFSFKKINKKQFFVYFFSIIWFICSLAPVIFLPWHKFTTYLTIPLIGVAIILSQLVYNMRQALLQKKRKSVARLLIFTFFAVYLSLSSISLEITRRVDWIGTGPRIAKRVFNYFKKIESQLENKEVVVFYDRPEDKNLLLSPSKEVKLALSGNNFFSVFYGGRIKAYFVGPKKTVEIDNALKLPARQFVEY